jgi:hypothetical protein
MLCLYEDPERTLLSAHKDAEPTYHRIFHFGLRLRDRAREGLVIDDGSPWSYGHSTSWYLQDPTGHQIEVAIWDQDQVRFG